MPFIVLSSADRDTGSRSDTNFTITTSQTFAGFKFGRLSKFVITDTLYNVPSGANTFTFKVADDSSGTNVVTLPISITPGNYQISDITAALKSACDTAIAASTQTGTTTWTPSTSTGKLTFGISGGKYISVVADNGTGLNLQLGFSRSTDFPLTLSNITAPRVYNLQKYNLLLLYTNIVVANSFNSNNSSRVSMLDMIPIAASNFGSILSYIPPNNDWIRLSETSLSSVFINVVDENGNNIDLNGGFCEVVIELHE